MMPLGPIKFLKHTKKNYSNKLEGGWLDEGG